MKRCPGDEESPLSPHTSHPRASRSKQEQAVNSNKQDVRIRKLLIGACCVMMRSAAISTGFISSTIYMICFSSSLVCSFIFITTSRNNRLLTPSLTPNRLLKYTNSWRQIRSLNSNTADASIQNNNNIDYGNNSNNNQALSALQRAVEIGTILGSQVMAPILSSLVQQQNWPTQENGGWESFWATCTPANTQSSLSNSLSHAQRLAMALEELGPTYVKFGQALGSRPDVVPPSLAKALSSLQDEMQPFDNDIAKEIICAELMGFDGKGKRGDDNMESIPLLELECLIESLTEVPVAAASIGQGTI